MHKLAPLEVEYVPATQLVQLVEAKAPALIENIPIGQDKQLMEPVFA